jgi:hypothetical protein
LELLQEPVREAAARARELDLPTVTFRTSLPSFSVYRAAITPNRTPRPGELAFLRVEKLDQLAHALPGARLEVVFRRGPVMLVRVSERAGPAAAGRLGPGR